MRHPARLGLVSYLNARPLGFGLLEGRQRGRYEIVEDVPSALADALIAGRLDLALVPSIVYAGIRQGGGNAAIVPGIGIASRGPAESVLLFSRLPLAEVRSIAVDASSRTSVALLRILLRRALQPGRPDPEFVTAPPDLSAMLSRADAALLIGDPALRAAAPGGPGKAAAHVVDLGAAWMDLTGLPFVFAFWAGPPRPDAAEIAQALADSLAEGTAALPAIARAHGNGDPALELRIGRYLAETMLYRLGADERRGLETFYRFAREEGLLAGPPVDLVFHPGGVE